MKELWDWDCSQHLVQCGLVGVDEAGRGCLAGPVCAGAVYLREAFYRESPESLLLSAVKDSKKMTMRAREAVFSRMEELQDRGHLIFSSAFADVGEIETHNILGATRLAMQRAIEKVLPTNGAEVPILVDGRPLRPFPYAHRAIVGGDGRSLAIAMASVVAKVSRDRWMDEAATHYPQYDWAKNKGYGTATHCQSIREHGPCPLHRALFLRKLGIKKPVV